MNIIVYSSLPNKLLVYKKTLPVIIPPTKIMKIASISRSLYLSLVSKFIYSSSLSFIIFCFCFLSFSFQQILPQFASLQIWQSAKC